MKNLLLFLLIVLFTFSCTSKREEQSLMLWYKQPAEKWTDALPIGNGRIGAMVFSKVDTERIQLNDESVWAGQPIDNNNPGAKAHLKIIQQLLLKGKINTAVKLSEKYLLGTPPRIRAYQLLGNLYLAFHNSGEVKDYKRELNLRTGIISTNYKIGDQSITRKVFCSAPDDIIVVQLESSTKGGLNFDIWLERGKDAIIKTSGQNSIVMNGQIIDKPDPLRGPGGKHIRFAARLLAKNIGGNISAESNYLKVKNADSVTIIFTAETDYSIEKLSFDKSINPELNCEKIISKAKGLSFKNLKDDHLKEYQSLFNRVELSLGKSVNDTIPTDERLERVKNGAEDSGLIALYFQYGRYLLMSSSRNPGVLPANLQGIWNKDFNPPWSSDFHTNINLQMNYWPAEVCNLPETVEPLTNFFVHIMKPGKRTAQKMYGARGWNMHHVTDPFGRTALMDGIQWGTSPLAGAWMSLAFWRHFQFTQDKDYLKNKAWPILKGAADFVLDFLIEDNKGRLVTAPSMSPENSYILPSDGKQYQITYAATIDMEIINELFKACIQAGKILNYSKDYSDTLHAVLKKLPPVRIGANGTIMEWIEDYKEVEPGHRHMSHLFALHPGTTITSETPELFEAARKTIERRLANGGGHTGWSRAWIINFYARLLDGENSYKHILALLRKSTLPNLFDTHPPFQIDGNFGGTSGIAEMLLQSQNGEIHILPALPSAWPDGEFRGLKARGNFEISADWHNGKLNSVTVKSLSGGKCKLKYLENVKTLDTKKGEIYTLNSNLN